MSNPLLSPSPARSLLESPERLRADAALPISKKAELLKELAREEGRLAELDQLRETTHSRVQSLREELALLSANQSRRSGLSVITTAQAPTPVEKVRLFRSLFKGRNDIFPTRFESKRTGKPGYAPACANKFVRESASFPRSSAVSARTRPSGRWTSRSSSIISRAVR